ncbi:MAG: tetratricopeptide repeat protein, partial [Micromonosporaceae bacterium]|nr:tetratricopeptide repeat protein [Micromonosporaceae bacterium]
GYRSTEAHATTLLAELDARAGRAEDAAAHARTALSAHRQTGHRAGEARTLLLLARLCESAGQPGGALRRRREALGIFADLGVPATPDGS